MGLYQAATFLSTVMGVVRPCSPQLISMDLNFSSIGENEEKKINTKYSLVSTVHFSVFCLTAFDTLYKICMKMFAKKNERKRFFFVHLTVG